MQLRTNYPLAKPLPIPQERIERGPFFADAKRLIKKDFLLQSRPPPQKATAQLFLMDHFKRMAVQRKMLPPPTLGIDTRMWMNEMLDMLREFIAYTPKNERCMCATMNLPEFHDHWLECPIGIVMKRARAAMSKKESDRKEAMQDRVTNVVAQFAVGRPSWTHRSPIFGDRGACEGRTRAKDFNGFNEFSFNFLNF